MRVFQILLQVADIIKILIKLFYILLFKGNHNTFSLKYWPNLDNFFYIILIDFKNLST